MDGALIARIIIRWTELHFLGTNYGDGINVGTLNVQLEIFEVSIKDGEFTCLDDILAKIKQLSEAEKCMISEINFL